MEQEIGPILSEISKVESEGSKEYGQALARSRKDLEDAKKQAEEIMRKAREDAERIRREILGQAASKTEEEENKTIREAGERASAIGRTAIPKDLVDSLLKLVEP